MRTNEELREHYFGKLIQVLNKDEAAKQPEEVDRFVEFWWHLATKMANKARPYANLNE